MKFSIITPTYQRSHLLARAIDSVLQQEHLDWEMIIVNDSPDDGQYPEVIKRYQNDSRIRYFRNETNRGVNYTRNRALDHLAADSDFVIFLDDDDYLTPQALIQLGQLSSARPKENWLMTNRVLASGEPITRTSGRKSHYRYAFDYLITRQITGDATHCIRARSIDSIRFPRHLRQAEEWLFYFELGRRIDIFYQDVDTTISDGYLQDGLNFRRRGFRLQVKSVGAILREGMDRGLIWSPLFLVYVSMRLIRTIVKRD